MSSPQSGPLGYTESLATKMDRLADALCNGHTAIREHGIYVDVHANGKVRTVVIDEDVTIDKARLGKVITALINRAREQAEQQVEQLVREVQNDPRVASIVEQIGDAPHRSLPPAPQAEEPWDEDDDPWRPKSRITAD